MGATLKWVERAVDVKLIEAFSVHLGVSPLLAKLLSARGAASTDEAQNIIKKSLSQLISPIEIPELEAAANRLATAVLEDEGIVVHGDFDADGISSTALMTLFFRDIHARVYPFVPNRLIENHGLSMRALEVAQSNKAKILVTCDCGSSNAKEILAFQKEGMEVIITDHHQVGDSKDAPCILVNPQNSMRAEHKDLAGVGVAFMVLTVVRKILREKNFFNDQRPEPNMKQYLDVVALGTLADMAPLTQQNRILVSFGLEELRNSTRPGIMAMKELAGLNLGHEVRSDDVGFRLAPRINAAARLGFAQDALCTLTAQNESEALEFAQRLEKYNQERKEKQEKMYQMALSLCELQELKKLPVLMVGHASFHSGLNGLVAQKLAENFFKPVFVYSVHGDILKASTRSRGGIDITAAMQENAQRLKQFGGHKEAGGCELKSENLNAFHEGMCQAVKKQTQAEPILWVDGEVSEQDLNVESIQMLKSLAPFGMKNPEPIFTATFKVWGDPKEVGTGHLKVRLLADTSGFDAIFFGKWHEHKTTFGKDRKVKVAFTPEINVFNGSSRVQLRVVDAKPV